MPKPDSISAADDVLAFPNARIPRSAKVITYARLTELAFCNSKDLPQSILVMRPRRMQWTGIGWIDAGEPKGDETVVTK